MVESNLRSDSSTLQLFSHLTIAISNRQRQRKLNRPLLIRIAETLLSELKIQDAELEINLVSAGEMIGLNERYLHHAGATDVIAFDYAERVGRASCLPAIGAHGVTRLTLHGEIFICVDEAIVQAKHFKTNWQSEVVRYVIHGVLHLLGYDDSRSRERRKMKQAENRLLRRLSRRFSLAQLGRAAKLSPCKSP